MIYMNYSKKVEELREVQWPFLMLCSPFLVKKGLAFLNNFNFSV